MARLLALAAPLAAVLALAATPSSALASRSTQTSRSTQSVSLDLGVFQQLNAIRVEHGLAPLELSATLDQAAEQHSQDMIAKGYFSHDSSDGKSFSDRLSAFYPEAGARYWAVGENILWSSGSPSVTRTMSAWMASPPHRANILDPTWRQIGISAVTSRDAPGTYGGRSVTVITTDFGVRR